MTDAPIAENGQASSDEFAFREPKGTLKANGLVAVERILHTHSTEKPAVWTSIVAFRI